MHKNKGVNKVWFSLNIFLIFLLLLFAQVAIGQQIVTDATAVDTVPENVEKIHSPQKAVIYSAILPGLGQAYNKKYWKIPIIYAGFGTIGYFIGWNNKYYGIYKQAYNDLTDGNSDTNSFEELKAAAYYNLENQTEYENFRTGLSKQREYFRRNRDLLIISIVGFYGLNIIDASVDAHLFNFDISEDLTFNWQPATSLAEDRLIYGFNCTFNF